VKSGYDVVVVGGGLVGTSLAYETACRGATVALIDRRDLGRASDAGAGILSPATTWQTHVDWYPFAAEAGSHYPRLIERLDKDGAPDPGYSRTGLLTISLSEGDESWYADLAARAIDRDPIAVGEITPDDARRRMPVLGDIRRVLHNREAARIDGRAMTASLRQACEVRGVDLIDGDVRRLISVGTRITQVESDVGTLAAGAVIIAGGAWSSDFAEQLATELDVRPVKGQIAHLAVVDPDLDPATWPIAQPVIGHYLVPWPDGRVACGGTFEDRAGFDARPTVAGTRELLRECLKLAPGLAEATLLEVRVGLRPFSRDDLPLLGALAGWENVYLDTGHGADGLLAGPYSGVLVSAVALGLEGSLTEVGRRALEAFSPSRFTV
jgi:D-amino-acid dehydrogenase